MTHYNVSRSSKKSGKTLKQKRAAKRAKADRASPAADVLHLRKH